MAETPSAGEAGPEPRPEATGRSAELRAGAAGRVPEPSRKARGAPEPRPAGAIGGPTEALPGFDPAAGFIGLMGLALDEVTPARVTAHLDVGPEHLQPYGLVHGGVYAAIAETVASVGAAVAAGADGSGRGAVGLENHTSFLRTAGAGRRIVAEAVVRHGGRRVHQWAVTMRDAEDGRELANSTVRLLLVSPKDV